jgi:hypothetical protein
MKYAQTIAAKSPFAIQLGKQTVQAQSEMGVADAYDLPRRRWWTTCWRRRGGGNCGLHREAQAGVDDAMMEPRISIVTLGVDDLDRATAFYEAMGLERHKRFTDGVAFFQMGGMILALWPREEIARDAGIRRQRREGHEVIEVPQAVAEAARGDSGRRPGLQHPYRG